MLASETPERVVVPGLGQHDPDVRERRLGEHAGHVPCASAASSASTSLNSTTRVVSVGSMGAPTFPMRGPATPSSIVTIVSSTEPW